MTESKHSCVQNIHKIEAGFQHEGTAVEKMWKVVTVEASLISEVGVKS